MRGELRSRGAGWRAASRPQCARLSRALLSLSPSLTATLRDADRNCHVVFMLDNSYAYDRKKNPICRHPRSFGLLSRGQIPFCTAQEIITTFGDAWESIVLGGFPNSN
jgi:hypothetical protein